MNKVLNETIKIKSALLTVFNQQIELLRKGKISELARLQTLEQELSELLNAKKNYLKHNPHIIKSCTDYDIIERLKDICITFDKTLMVKSQLLEKAKFFNGKMLEVISRVINKTHHDFTYNKMGSSSINKINSTIINWNM